MIRNNKVPPTLNYEDFFYNNEPDNTGILLELYNSVNDCSADIFFRTEEVDRGRIKYVVTAASGEQLLLTSKSRTAFLGFIQAQNPDSELDLEERAAFEYSVNNPHS